MRLWAIGRGDEARSVWGEVPATAPQGTSARLYGGLERLFRREFAEARPDLERARGAPGSEGRLASAALAIIADDWAGAREALRDAAGWEAGLLRAWVESLDPSGDRTRAVQDYGTALSAGVPFAWAYSNRGVLRRQLRELPGAVADFTEALRLEPRLAATWNNRAFAYLAIGDHARVIADASRAIELDPALASAWNNRGVARAYTGDIAGALRDLEQAVRLNPRDASARKNLGKTRRDSGDPLGSVTDLSEAIRVAPEDAEAWNQRGVAFRDARQWDRALEDFTEAIRLAPRDPSPRFNRGAARRETGDLDGAFEDLSETLRLDPRRRGRGAAGPSSEGVAETRTARSRTWTRRSVSSPGTRLPGATAAPSGGRGANWGARSRTTPRRSASTRGCPRRTRAGGWRGERRETPTAPWRTSRRPWRSRSRGGPCARRSRRTSAGPARRGEGPRPGPIWSGTDRVRSLTGPGARLILPAHATPGPPELPEALPAGTGHIAERSGSMPKTSFVTPGLVCAASLLAGCSSGGAGGGQPSADSHHFKCYSGPHVTADASRWPLHAERHPAPSAAYRWLEIILEASARRNDRIGARPTTIAREMAISCTAMFDAWACYDASAVGTRLGGALRRPEAERTDANREKAIGYAVTRCLEDLFPEDLAWVRETAKQSGVDPANGSTEPGTPEGVGNAVAAALIEYRHNDGSNQLGDDPRGNGKPYSDTSGYKPFREPGQEQDPDRWMPISFANPDGKPGRFTPRGLTPHWGRVKCIGVDDPGPFRMPGPPKADSDQMRREVDECIEANANLSLRQKAIVEFMRDGPRSTGQSGHWLRFAQDLSRRDRYGLDQDVKLFFSIAAMAHDAFVVCWNEKYHFDSSRPYWYVRWFHKGRKVNGYAGPCKGFRAIPAEEWHPYSPDTFVTPPFPGYPSGHATVSGACSKMLELFSGSDRFEFLAKRSAGELTETDCSTYEMQAIEGAPATGISSVRDVDLPLPTFSATAEMAAESRMLGGYHIRTDNDHGLDLGRKLAVAVWPRYRAHWEGTAPQPR
ncbi:MAG: tetratricopeptide repeat protein [Planctomycetales bacterium]|nr:tetratricopeptide repeat protein [Planctomycetales bacterium]